MPPADGFAARHFKDTTFPPIAFRAIRSIFPRRFIASSELIDDKCNAHINNRQGRASATSGRAGMGSVTDHAKRAPFTGR
jgi:hypothetical protein